MFQYRFLLPAGYILTFFFLYVLPAIAADVPADSIAADSSAVSADSIEYIETDSTLVQRSETLVRTTFEQGKHLIITGLRASTEYTASIIEDPEQIVRIRDLVRIEIGRWGWYPTTVFVSGMRFQPGAKFYYSTPDYGFSFSGAFATHSKWYGRYRVWYQQQRGDRLFKLILTAEIRLDDDLRFYGIGSDPENDSRSHFRPGTDQEYGVFTLRRQKIQIVAAMRPSPNLEHFFTIMWSQREVHNSGQGDNKFRTVVDESLPGAYEDQTNIYFEFDIRYDTRHERGALSPGIMGEGYFGFMPGFDLNQNSYIQVGTIAALYFPVVPEKWVISPSLHINAIRPFESNESQLSFLDYPRHPAFRGVTSRWLYRLDEISHVTSLDSRHAISRRFAATFFYDQINVAMNVRDMSWRNAPWAVGARLDYHNRDNILAFGIVAWGTAGWRFQAGIGIKENVHFRTEWY